MPICGAFSGGYSGTANSIRGTEVSFVLIIPMAVNERTIDTLPNKPISERSCLINTVQT